MKTKTIEQERIDTVRILAADAVQKANSGHPGTPMGLASVGHVLWAEIMTTFQLHSVWGYGGIYTLFIYKITSIVYK